MKVSTNALIQFFLIVIQIILAVNPSQLPLKWQGSWMTVVAIAQAAMGVLAHYSTPSGVPITPGATITTKEEGSKAAR